MTDYKTVLFDNDMTEYIRFKDMFNKLFFEEITKLSKVEKGLPNINIYDLWLKNYNMKHDPVLAEKMFNIDKVIEDGYKAWLDYDFIYYPRCSAINSQILQNTNDPDKAILEYSIKQIKTVIAKHNTFVYIRTILEYSIQELMDNFIDELSSQNSKDGCLGNYILKEGS